MYLWKTLFTHRHCYRPWSLRINYVTQLSVFQETLWKLWEVSPDPASESNKPLFEPGTEVLIDFGIWRPISRAPLGRPLPGYSFFSHSCQGARNWVLGATTLKLKSGTLAKTKQCHFMFLSSMLSPFTFQMGPIIYVGLLLLTPKVLSAIWP